MAVGTGVGKCLHTLPSHPVVGKPYGFCRETLACKWYPSKHRLFADVDMPQRRRLVRNRGRNCTTSAGSSVRNPILLSSTTFRHSVSIASLPPPPYPSPTHAHLPPCKYQKYIWSAIVMSYELIWSIPDTFFLHHLRSGTDCTPHKQNRNSLPTAYHGSIIFIVFILLICMVACVRNCAVYTDWHIPLSMSSLTLGQDSYFTHSQ